MTPQEFANRMAEIAAISDKESAHEQGDALMMALLEEHGYSDGVATFQAMGKWYA